MKSLKSEMDNFVGVWRPSESIWCVFLIEDAAELGRCQIMETSFVKFKCENAIITALGPFRQMVARYRYSTT